MMTNSKAKELLEQLLSFENQLRDGDKWGAFSKGIAKAYHGTLEKDRISSKELIELFLRFMDERVAVAFFVDNEAIAASANEKKVLDGRLSFLENQLRVLGAEKNSLAATMREQCDDRVRRLEEAYKERIETLKRANADYREKLVRLQKNEASSRADVVSASRLNADSDALGKYAVDIRFPPGPTMPESNYALSSGFDKAMKAMYRWRK